MSLVVQLAMLAHNELGESKWFEPFYLETVSLPEGESAYLTLSDHINQLFDWAKELILQERDLTLFGVCYDLENRKIVCLPQSGGCSIPDAEFLVEQLWSARDKFLLASRWATNLFPRLGVMFDMICALFAAPELEATIPMSTWTISDDDETWVRFLDLVTRYYLCCSGYEELRTAMMIRKFPNVAQNKCFKQTQISLGLGRTHILDSPCLPLWV
ncbi:unnamed protein product [Rhizoctonia solani]|uniref:Uncharacterized protein n=1 Tax=Rhizoctonia solani TaxID=456999 RepID=A0A8H2X364_9AGAM|nr:unnamed protein product [Rhizoctonia solani]